MNRREQGVCANGDNCTNIEGVCKVCTRPCMCVCMHVRACVNVNRKVHE